MRAVLVAALALTLAPAVVHAQAPYTVVDGLSGYRPLASGTSYTPVAYAQATDPWDEGAAEIPLPFPFYWYGVRYTRVFAYTNGFLSFLPPPPNGGPTGLLAPPFAVPSPANVPHAFIAPMWTDLFGDPMRRGIRADVTGTAPMRTFIVEMRGLRRFNDPTSDANFQVQLEETTNRVHIVYGPSSGIANATVGIEDAQGVSGYNLLATGLSCGQPCACTPRTCGSSNWATGLEIILDLPNQAELIASIRGPLGAYPGATFTASVSVANVGAGAAGPSTAEVRLSADNTVDNSDTFLGMVSIPALAAGTSTTVRTVVRMPMTTTVGRYVLGVIADSGNVVAEAIENDNTGFDPNGIVSAPNLRATVMSPAASGPGEVIDVRLDVRAEGLPVTRPIAVRVHVSSTAMPMPGSLAYSGTVTLADGFATQVTIPVTVPAALTPSPPVYRVLVELDPMNDLAETNEADNLAVSPTMLALSVPDIITTDLVASSLLFRGRPYPVTVVIRNDGGTAARNFKVCVVISRNQLISLVSDPILVRTSSLTLLANETSRLRFEPVIPTDTGTGAWYLAAVADCESTVVEQLEPNNVRRLNDPVLVRDPAPDFEILEVTTATSGSAGEAIPVSVRVGNTGNAPGAVTVRFVLSDNAGITTMDRTIYETPMPVMLQPPRETTISAWAQIPADLAPGRWFVGAIADPAGAVDEVSEENNARGIMTAIPISGAELTITSPRPPNAVIGVPYVWRYGAVGGTGPYTWTVTWTNGAPAGLTFDAATGEVHGTPAMAAEGRHELRVSVTSGNVTITRTDTILITTPLLPLRVISGRLPPAQSGERYSVDLVAVGGLPPYTWSVEMTSRLPPGLGLDEGGTLGGEPSVVQAYFFTVRVRDSLGASDVAQLALDVIDPAAALTIKTADLPTGTVGEPYQVTFEVSGGTAPYMWRLDGGPIPGLQFDTVDVTLVGTPTIAGSYPLVLEVRDSKGLFDRNAYILQIYEEGQLQITQDSVLPKAIKGQSYTDGNGAQVFLRARKGGELASDLRWMLVLGSMPPGISLDETTGLIGGVPQEAGVYPFTVLVRDPSGDNDRATFAIVVDQPQETTTTTTTDDSCSCNTTSRTGGDASALWLGFAALLGLVLTRRIRGLGVAAAALVGTAAVAKDAAAQTPPYQVITSSITYAPLANAIRLNPPNGLADGGTARVALPFEFEFFGRRYAEVWINANGFISFEMINAGFHSPPNIMPDPLSNPNGWIAGLWADWCTSVGVACPGPVPPADIGVYVAIEGQPGTRTFAVEWRNIRHYNDVGQASRVSFQIILSEGAGSVIELVYGPLTPGLQTNGPTNFGARIGIESGSGTQGMWIAPCANALRCDAAQVQGLTNRKITLVADAGEDVAVAGVSTPPLGFPGLDLPITARVISRHRNPLGPFTVGAYLLPAAETSTLGGTRLAQLGPITLQGFESRSVSLALPIPNDTLPASYRVAVVADDLHELRETNELNNTGLTVSPVRVTDRGPDFAVRAVRVTPRTVMPGGAMSIGYTVENAGNERGSLDLRAVLSINGAITPQDRLLGMPVTIEAPARSTHTGTITATLPGDIGSGLYAIGLLADAAGAVAELDETNNAGQSADRIAVASQGVTITTERFPVATQTVPYTATIEAVGGSGTYTWRLTNGQLPRGTIFDASRAQIYGIPLDTGTFSLQLEVRSGTFSSRKSLDLVVISPDVPLQIVTRALPAAVIGSDYAVTVRTVGGTEPFTWTELSPLPLGLVLGSDGTILGVPRAPGSQQVALRVRDDRAATATVSLDLEVRVQANLTILTNDLRSGLVDQPYSETLLASGGTPPIRWRLATAAPPGITISMDGVLAGTPSKVGSYRMIVEASDDAGNADTTALTLVVAQVGNLSIATPSLAVGRPGQDYRGVIKAAGGKKPYTWSLVREAGALPPGFDAKLGVGTLGDETEDDYVLTGKLEREGVWAFVVRVEDAAGRTAEQAFAIYAREPPAPPAPMPVEESGCTCTTSRPEARGAWAVLCALALGFTLRLPFRRRRWSSSGAVLRSLQAALIVPLLLAVEAPAGAQGVPYVATQFSQAFVPLAGGTPITFLNNDDGGVVIPIGFTFPFYGSMYSFANVGVNGFIALSNSGMCNACPSGESCPAGATRCQLTTFPHTPPTPPSTSLPNAVIAAWWDDLSKDTITNPVSSVLYATLGTAPNRELVVEWRNIRHLSSTASSYANFQIRISEGGAITLAYGPYVTGTAWSGIITVENPAGTEAVSPLSCSTTPSSYCGPATMASLVNTAFLIAPANGPELVGEVTAQTGANPGESVRVRVTARNVGTQPTSGGFDADVYLSTDQIINPGSDLRLGRVSFPATASQRTSTATLTTTLPSTVAAGYYSVAAILDSTNLVMEAVEQNNVAIASRLFLVGAELAMVFNTPASGASGDTVPVSFRIVNAGSAVPSVGWEVYISADRTLDAADMRIARGSTAIAAQPETTVTATATIPMLPGGRYYLIGRVDPAGQINEADEGNNTSVSDQFLVGPDLRVSVTSPANGGPGERVMIPMTISNAGSPVAVVPYAIRLSRDAMLSADDTLVTTGTIALGSMAMRAFTVTATVPVIIPGTYRVLAIVDPLNAISEVDETNNLGASMGSITIVGPDLVAVDVQGDAAAYRGSTMVVRGTIRNAGGARASNVFYSLHLSDNQLVTIQDPLLGEYGPLNLAPGDTFNFTHTVTISSTIAAGNWFLGLIADSQTTILEELENNNIKRWNTTIVVRDRAPDFVAGDINAQQLGAAGELLTIARRVDNIGNAAGMVTYAVYVSVDNDIDPMRDVLVGMGATRLDPSGSDEGVDAVRLPSDLAAGVYYVGYILDPMGQVSELNEMNNRAVSTRVVSVESSQLTVLTRMLPPATTSLRYEFDLAATGGSGAYRWSVVMGALPDGLMLDAGGRISGTPEKEGASDFTVSVSDGSLVVSRQFHMLVIEPTVQLAIVSRAIPPAWMGRRYEFQLVALGGAPPYTWSTDSTLPQGFGFTPEGVISSPAPMRAANVTINVRVTDAAGAIDERPIAILVIGADDAVRFTSDALEDGVLGKDYEQRLHAMNGVTPYRYEVAQGDLPPGLMIDGDLLEGIPTMVGTYTFTLRVVDNRGDFDLNRYVVAIDVNEGVKFVTKSLPAGVAGTEYKEAGGTPVRLKAVSTGVMGDLHFTVVLGSLPEGLTLADDGLLSGTPAKAGLYAFTVQASDDAGQKDFRALGVEISDPPVEMPPPTTTSEGCGCSTAHGSSPSALAVAFAIIGLALLARRRRALLGVLVAACALAPLEARAQVPYFVNRSMAPYVERMGGMSIAFSSQDDAEVVVSLPFPFNFYGMQQSMVHISTNGYITFGASATSLTNTAFPSTSDPDGVIAAWWDDLIRPIVTVNVEGTAPTRVAIIQWKDTSRWLGAASDVVNFQIWLYEGLSGQFEIRYGPGRITTTVFDASAGFENGDGTMGMPLLACSPACSSMDFANALNTVITVAADAGEDILAGGVSAPLRVYQAVPFEARARLISQHRTPIGPFVYSYYLQPLNGPIPTTPFFTSGPIILGIYEDRMVVDNVTIPLATNPGRYKIVMRADTGEQIAEPDENNNTSVTMTDVTVSERKPDLTAPLVRLSTGAAMPGDRLMVTASLRNAGNITTTTAWSLYLSPNRVVTTDDLQVYTSTTITLPPVTTATRTVEITVPTTIVPGGYRVGVVMDPSNRVGELNEINNVGVAMETLRVGINMLEIRTLSLPRGYVSVPYETYLVASGGDGRYTWSIEGGMLPMPLGLVGSSGLIRGTPASPAMETLTVKVTSRGLTAMRTLPIEILPLNGALTIVTRELTPGLVGQAYPPAQGAMTMPQRVVAVGGSGAVTFTMRGNPPPGLTFDPDGLLHGTPEQPGTFSLDVAATDGTSTATRAVSLTIGTPGRLELVPSALPDGILDEDYSFQLTVLGRADTGTIAFSLPGGETSLPPGLSLTERGQIVGLPTKVGTWDFAVDVVEGTAGNAPRDSANFTLTVRAAGGFSITPTTIPAGEVGAEYEATLEARGGMPEYVWRVITQVPLPRGVHFEVVETNGVQKLRFAGTPEAVPEVGADGTDSGGCVAIRVLLEDAQGRKAEQPLLLCINEPAPVVTMPPTTTDGSCGCNASRTGAPSLGVVVGLGLLLLARSRRKSRPAKGEVR